MKDSSESAVLRRLIEHANSGDVAARGMLLEHAYDRLCLLAAEMLAESFPTIKNRHEVNSIVHETWLKLDRVHDKTQPPILADFFRLAVFKIRQVLLDIVDRSRDCANKAIARASMILSCISGWAAPSFDREQPLIRQLSPMSPTTKSSIPTAITSRSRTAGLRAIISSKPASLGEFRMNSVPCSSSDRLR